MLFRLGLKQIFLLFVCVAVGLTVSPSLLGFLEPAIATAVAIGLFEEVLQLVRKKSCQPGREYRFAKAFAITWRAFFVISLIAHLIYSSLLMRGYVSYERRDVFPATEFANEGGSLCVVIAILVSVGRWRLALATQSISHRYLIGGLFAAFLVAFLMIMEGTAGDYIVHLAVAGVEEAQDPRWRRQGVYVSLEDEGYFTLWFASTALVALFAYGIMVLKLRSPSRSSHGNYLRLATFASLLLIPVVFYSWYCKQGLERLSPEIAEAGLAMVASDWLFAVWVSVIAITAGAYWVARIHVSTESQYSQDISDYDFIPLHESLPCLVALVLNSMYLLWVWSYALFDTSSGFGRQGILFNLSLLWYPTTLLEIAFIGASLQLCWYRWKLRNHPRPAKLYELSPKVFGQSWVALALLLAVGVPTLRAFAFIAWLGPIDFLSVFGYG